MFQNISSMCLSSVQGFWGLKKKNLGFETEGSKEAIFISPFKRNFLRGTLKVLHNKVHVVEGCGYNLTVDNVLSCGWVVDLVLILEHNYWLWGLIYFACYKMYLSLWVLGDSRVIII